MLNSPRRVILTTLSPAVILTDHGVTAVCHSRQAAPAAQQTHSHLAPSVPPQQPLASVRLARARPPSAVAAAAGECLEPVTKPVFLLLLLRPRSRRPAQPGQRSIRGPLVPTAERRRAAAVAVPGRRCSSSTVVVRACAGPARVRPTVARQLCVGRRVPETCSKSGRDQPHTAFVQQTADRRDKRETRFGRETEKLQ